MQDVMKSCMSERVKAQDRPIHFQIDYKMFIDKLLDSAL